MLRHFLTVAELGSFTRASEHLNASQPVVSRSVKRLEDELGVALIERTTRHVKLTPAGEAYYREARSLVDRLTLANENARRIGSGERAVIRVGVCPSTEVLRVAPGLQAFRELWPEIEIELSSIHSAAQPELLRSADLDVGVMTFDPADRRELEWRIIRRSPLMVAVPSVWKLEKRRVRLEELRDRPWIFPDPKEAGRAYQRQLALCRAAGFEPKIVNVVADPVTSALLLACGVGAAFSPGRTPTGPGAGCDLLDLDVTDPFVADMAVAWAAGSNSKQVHDVARSIVDQAEPPSEWEDLCGRSPS